MFELLLERRMEERRQNIGFLSSVIANSAFGRSKDSKTLTPLDFFPDHKQEEEEETEAQSPELQESILRSFFSRFTKKK